MMTHLNIQWIKVSGCILLLSVLVGAQQTVPTGVQVLPKDLASMSIKGRSLSADEAKALEETLLKTPADVPARVMLISYYSANYKDQKSRVKKCEHVHWMIENFAASEFLHYVSEVRLFSVPPNLRRSENSAQMGQCYDKGKELWLKNLEANKGNLVVLRNAIDYFSISDREFAEKLMRQGVAADPQNSKWHTELAHHFQRQVTSEKDSARRKELALKSVEEFEIALKLATDPIGRRSLRISLARMEFEAGETTKAEAVANKILTEVNDAYLRSDEVHGANTTLGLIALQKGDTQEAKRRLLLSGEVAGSPVLNSFGPSMVLAKVLAEKGETETVLQYLASVGSFWKNEKLQGWVITLKDGRVPNFGVNEYR
jgi:tetratricopeptide (TPR) repeat protein